MKNNKEIIRRNKKKLHGRNVRREVGYIENANFRGKKSIICPKFGLVFYLGKKILAH